MQRSPAFLFLLFVLLVGWFFLSSYIFMVLYNFSVPRIAGSIDPDQRAKFQELYYPEAIVIYLFLGLVFGPINVNYVERQCNWLERKMK